MNLRVDIQEDIKRYQNTLSYTSSKVDCSIGESIYMLPSHLKLKIKTGTVGYNNKILVSDEKFILGKNDDVSLMTPAIKNHKTNSLETPTIKSHKTNSSETPAMKSTHNSERTADMEQKTIISHEDEKVALVLSLTGIFTIWLIFLSKSVISSIKKVSSRRPFLYGAPAEVLITITLTTSQLV